MKSDTSRSVRGVQQTRGRNATKAPRQQRVSPRHRRSPTGRRKLKFAPADKPPDFAINLANMFREVPFFIQWDAGKIRIATNGGPELMRASPPSCLRTGSVASFKRQLNNFGFHKSFSESSRNLLVYVREDMLGRPPDDILYLRQKAGHPHAVFNKQNAVPTSNDKKLVAEPEDDEDDFSAVARKIANSLSDPPSHAVPASHLHPVALDFVPPKPLVVNQPSRQQDLECDWSVLTLATHNENAPPNNNGNDLGGPRLKLF
ncbi:hypothetical protein CTAYLR_000045 [Chrysophaeum taylorii]|uniref:HSF-type DNA-binding domain-containing protein n=1 Tax=Chrysophaeum taylorii TaxID=2483200 RepID=A0AAD7UHC9_9STRA|nr:hypothetical protein CTAYLR_000045 [Chrysophaeum taylorii]